MRKPKSLSKPKENQEPIEVVAATSDSFDEEIDELPEEMLPDYVRTIECIQEAEQEFFERVWFSRNTTFIADENGRYVLVPRHEAGRNFVEALLKKYGGWENLLPKDEFELGMMNGKLSALRWVLGDEWDFLDT